MNTHFRKITRALLAFVVTMSGLALTGSMAIAAPVTINLCAVTGTATLTGSVTVPVWGFVPKGTQADCSDVQNTATLPGPVLSVNELDTVTVNVTNALPAATAPVHSIVFEIPGVSFNPGPVDAAVGATLSVTFTANAPGTYLYQSAGDSGRQEAMGLTGALIVRPTSAPDTTIAGQAYHSTSSAYDVESVLVLSQVDLNFNASPDTFNLNTYRATYWLINGKAYPDTAGITAAVGQRVLIRYINAGYDNTAMMLLGMHERVLARDAHLLNNPFDANAETIPAGGTEDVVVTVPATAPPGANGFPLFNRNLHVTNGTPSNDPGGMLTFIHP